MSREERIVNIKAAEFVSHSIHDVLRKMADFVEEHKIVETWDTTIECGRGRFVGVVYYWKEEDDQS